MPQSPRLRRFITVEGGDGAGKSSALDSIRSSIEATGRDVIVTREPGGTAIAEQIRNLVLSATSSERLCPQAETLLLFAARAQHIENVVRPALERGAVVLCDRFTDSSYAYQGAGRGLAMHDIAELEARFVGFRPIGTLLLDVPVSMGCSRARTRPGATDRIELEEHVFFERVRQCYLDRAAAEPDRFVVVDASMPLDEVQASIRAAVETRLSDWA